MLCPRCGSPGPEPAGASTGRCAECGLTWSSTRIEARPSANEDVALARRVRDLENRFTGPPPGFADASFSPCGLDAQWSGARWFGSVASSGDAYSHLELNHGAPPWEPTEPLVRVRSQVPSAAFIRDSDGGLQMESFMLVRELVERLWHRTGTIDEDVRAAAFPVDGRVGNPTEPWLATTLNVDGLPVAFSLLSGHDAWVALALHRNVVLGIDAFRWPVERTALISVTNFDDYVGGARKIRNTQPGLS